MLLLGSTQREEDSKREITVIVACIVEEDGEVIMDLEQTDEQETPYLFWGERIFPYSSIVLFGNGVEL